MSEYAFRLLWSGNSHKSQVSHDREPCHVGRRHRKWAHLITVTEPPPKLLIQWCSYFDISAFFLFLVKLEGQTQLFHTEGSFFWHRKRKERKKAILPPELIWLHKTVDSGPNVAALGGGATSIYCQAQVLKDNWALAGMCMHWSAGFLTGFELTHST